MVTPPSTRKRQPKVYRKPRQKLQGQNGPCSAVSRVVQSSSPTAQANSPLAAPRAIHETRGAPLLRFSDSVYNTFIFACDMAHLKVLVSQYNRRTVSLRFFQARRSRRLRVRGTKHLHVYYRWCNFDCSIARIGAITQAEASGWIPFSAQRQRRSHKSWLS